MFDNELTNHERQVRLFLKEEFYDENDDAHKIGHIDEVWSNICELINNNEFKFNINRDIIFLAVYLHDIKSGENRKRHNILAALLVREKYFLNYPILNFMDELDEYDLYTISTMIYHHRASMIVNETLVDSEERLVYINLLRAADKGKPIFKEVLNRATLYHKGDDDMKENVKAHLIEKFGSEGYFWENDLAYKKIYENEFKQFQIELNEYISKVI